MILIDLSYRISYMQSFSAWRDVFLIFDKLQIKSFSNLFINMLDFSLVQLGRILNESNESKVYPGDLVTNN